MGPLNTSIELPGNTPAGEAITDSIEIRGLRLKNRILMSAMSTSRAHYPERARSDDPIGEETVDSAVS